MGNPLGGSSVSILSSVIGTTIHVTNPALSAYNKRSVDELPDHPRMNDVVRNTMTRFTRTFLQTSLFFGIWMTVCFSVFLRGDWRAGLLGGVLAGILFGLFMALFQNSARVRHSAQPQLRVDERILKAGPANHGSRLGAMGGWLVLTTQRLVFKTHSFNLRKYELSLPLSRITSVEPTATVGLIPNSIQVRLLDGRVERFSVDERTAWRSDITATIVSSDNQQRPSAQ